MQIFSQSLWIEQKCECESTEGDNDCYLEIFKVLLGITIYNNYTTF